MEFLKQNYVKYGLILTAGLVVCLALMEVTGDNNSFDEKSPIFLIYQFILPAVIWYLGLRAKKKQLGGKLTFKQGVKESFKMSLVFGITSPFLFLAYYLFVNPGILDFVKRAYGMPDMTDSAIIALDMFVQFIAALIFGTMYGAIISFFVKTKSN